MEQYTQDIRLSKYGRLFKLIIYENADAFLRADDVESTEYIYYKGNDHYKIINHYHGWKKHLRISDCHTFQQAIKCAAEELIKIVAKRETLEDVVVKMKRYADEIRNIER